MLSKEDLFQCTQCGDCCKGYGGTRVSNADITAIGNYLGITAQEVIDHYCVLSGKNRVLAQRTDGYCCFWEKKCSIHPVKPQMCRQWPFIQSLLVDTANWQIMATVCPGMRQDVSEEDLIIGIKFAFNSSST